MKRDAADIHPDDGGPNIFVDRSAVERAGLSDLKTGQRIIFEIQRDERTGEMSAVSLKVLAPATPAPFDRLLATANRFRHHLCLYLICNFADLAARKNVTSLERAFQLARSGQVSQLEEIVSALRACPRKSTNG